MPQHFFCFVLTVLFLCRHGTILHPTHICPFVYMFQQDLLHIFIGFSIFYERLLILAAWSFVLYIGLTSKQTICGVCGVDVMIYLLFWYDNWHVTQHNRTMNTYIIDPWANRWCRGLLRPGLAAPLPQPAAHLALATSFGTERTQRNMNAKCQALGLGQVEVI